MAINVVIEQAMAGGSSIHGQVVEWILEANHLSSCGDFDRSVDGFDRH